MTLDVTRLREWTSRDLPAGWRWTPVEEAVMQVRPDGHVVPKSQYQATGRFPVIDQGHAFIGGYTDDLRASIVETIPTVVFGDHTRRIKFIDFPFALGAQGTKVLRAAEGWDPKFLAYAMAVCPLDNRGYGRHWAELRKARLPQPSLGEQKALVARVDEQVTRLDAANDALLAAERHLAAYRYRLLTEAFVGIASTAKLADLCDVFVDCEHRTPDYGSGKLPAIRPRDVVAGKLDLSQAGRVSEVEYRRQTVRHTPMAGDIVYSRELSFGWAVEIPDSERLCLGQGMVVFRVGGRVRRRWVTLFLNGPQGRRQAQQGASGTAHPHVNLPVIKDFSIPTPSLPMQDEILGRLDAQLFVVDVTEREVRRVLGRAERLLQGAVVQIITGVGIN